MLFKPAWARYSLENLTAWLERQPASKTYVTWSINHCLIGQWLRFEHGLEGVEQTDLCAEMGQTAPFATIAGIDCDDAERTFGAALTRARVALERHHD